MKRSSKIGLILAGIFLLTAGLLLFSGARGPKPTPEMRIAEALSDAEEGARRRRVSDVMEVVSKDFRAGSLNRDRLRLLLMRSLNQGRGVRYDVQVTKPRIFPSPKGRANERLVVSRFSVFFTDSGDSIWGTDSVTLVMREETRRKWLFFQEPHWRIVSIANLPPIPGGDDSGGGLFSL